MTQRWKLEFTASARRDLRRLDEAVRQRVFRAIAALANDPFASQNVRALAGADGYRLRVGDWRVLYRLDGDRLIVLVVRIAHRREVYR